MSKKLAHAIVSDYLHISKELGRPPSQDYYLLNGIYSKRNIDSAFGGWTQLIQAAGYQIPSVKKDKTQIEIAVSNHIKKESQERKLYALPPMVYHHVFVWSDRHRPYSHPDTIQFLIAIKRKYKFDLVIDIGDGEDFHGMSFHDKDPDLLSPGHELEKIIEQSQEIYKEFPNVLTCESNHGSLVYRKGKHHGFPRHVLKSYREVLQAPEGWEWHHEIIIQMSDGRKCLFHHGYSANTLLASQKRGMSLVQGHFHSKFGIQYWENATDKFFAAQTGCLIDDKSYAFAYNKLGLERPILGCLRIENGVPHLLPMHLDRSGRWNGVVP